MGENQVKLGFVGAGVQSGWGSSVSGYKGLNYSAATPPIKDGGVSVEDKDWMAANSVTMEEERVYVNKYGTLPTLSFEWTMVGSLLATHFGALLFDKSVAGNLYTFKPEDTVLDFAGGEGELNTVLKQWATHLGTDHTVLKNAIIGDMSIAIDNKATGLSREAIATGNWVGSKAEYEIGSFSVNTLTPTTGLLADGRKWKLTWSNPNGVWIDHCFHNITISFSNSVEGICRSSDGEPGNFRITPEISVQMSIPNTPDVAETMSAYLGGYENVIILTNYTHGGAPSASNDIAFTIPNVYMSATPDAPDGKYEAWNIQGTATRTSTGWADIVQFYV